MGYSLMVKKDESIKTYINDLLHWIMLNKQKLLRLRKKSSDGKTDTFDRLNIDFVCWRGLLTKLLCIPYENREDLLVAVIYFRGTYYMCEYDTDHKILQKKNATPEQEEMCAWGFKFEQYVTADKGLGIPCSNVPVNTNAEFGSIVCSHLGTNSLMFGAEVDCEDPNSQENNKYVELKTSRIIDSQRQYENFCRHKLIKWWAQSFVLGIRHIVCGLRDDSGVVRKLEDFYVSKIPSIVQETLKYPWKPNVCFNFLTAFLDFVKANITVEDRRCVYLFRWQPGSNLSFEKRENDKNYNFLPDWFTEWKEWDK
ncbi:hypothetical protein Btru_055247 [Bulinus truncatus]|nr:hypothetical protein Btru_055247 [Bulinus truncatus]